jgi:hypothetical protein
VLDGETNVVGVRQACELDEIDVPVGWNDRQDRHGAAR